MVLDATPGKPHEVKRSPEQRAKAQEAFERDLYTTNDGTYVGPQR